MPNVQNIQPTEQYNICQNPECQPDRHYNGLVLQPIFTNNCYQFGSSSFPDVVPESELQINTNSIYYTDPSLQLGSMPHMIMGYQSPSVSAPSDIRQPKVLYKAVSMLQSEDSTVNLSNPFISKSFQASRKQSQLKIIIIETNGSETSITGHLSNSNDSSASVTNIEKDKTAKIILTELPNISVELPTKTTCEMVI